MENTPTTVQGLKQALSQQPVAVAVDATSWSTYTSVSPALLTF